MKIKRFFKSLLVLSIFGVLSPVLPVSASEYLVKDIRVEGLQRISAGTVFNYLPVKIGETIDTDDTPDIIKSLFKTGFFKDIKLEYEDDVLVVYVQERPAIDEIDIQGNKSIETEALLEGLKDIGLQQGRTFNRSVLDKIEQELRRQYFSQGKYAVELNSTVTPLERNRVGIKISIVEGDTARIKSINIVGNKSFDEEELLDTFSLGIPPWYDFLSKKDQYSRQKLSADMESLRSWYLDRGYINFKIDSTQVSISPDKQDIFITINIKEGDIYTIRDIKLAGDFILPKEDLFPMIHLVRNEIFSRKNIVESSERLTKKLTNYGYAFANVNSIPEIDEETKSVAVTFFVDPGKRVYVRRINITGNDRTRDQVLRREVRQMETGWYAANKVKQSRERLQRLGYFDSVNIETPAVPGSADQVDLNVNVEEKSSGSFLAGVGYSQSQGVVFNTSVTEKNFFGTGKSVTLALNTSSTNTLYQLGFNNPYYTVDGVSRGFNLKWKETDFEELDSIDYTTDEASAGVSFGIPTNEFDRINLTANIRNTAFTAGGTAPGYITQFDGEDYLDFVFGLSWSHDSRDSALFPKKGGRQRVAASVTVPGSDLQYFQLSYSNKHYFPLSKDVSFALNAELGYGESYGDTSAYPFFENFFAGGPSSVRGFEANSLGARTLPSNGDPGDDPTGGNVKIVGGAELILPVPIDSFKDTARWGAFFDIGNVFLTDDTYKPFVDNVGDIQLDDLRYSLGVTGSWLSPIGALSVSYGVPLNDKTGDKVENFQFNLGQTF